MKRIQFFIILFILVKSIFAVSIHDIQYTENSVDGTFPSPYEGQIIETGGIVTATIEDEGYFLQSSTGGTWSGIYVYDEIEVSVGDSLIINGEIIEYYGLTEIAYISSMEIISQNNDLPPATIAFTSDLDSEEAYESVLVQVNNPVVSSGLMDWNYWQIDDGSGECTIGASFINFADTGFPLIQNYSFESISGIINYAYGEYLLQPRSISDFSSYQHNFILSIPNNQYFTDDFTIPINIHFLGNEELIENYSISLDYNQDIISFENIIVENTLSENGSTNILQNDNIITINFDGSINFADFSDNLINLAFNILNDGASELTFDNISINDSPIQYFQNSTITIQQNAFASRDTITIIHKPLLNIPEIGTPGEEFEILCYSNTQVNQWNASINFENYNFPLNLQTIEQNNDFYTLVSEFPQTDFYELFDLIVEADGIIDTMSNAVKIMSEEKEEYYFVQITDTHLPTHIFYGNEESVTDTSEVIDFRKVIEDINLINPEFVLLTGDLINEGELEDFNHRRYYTISQRLLNELEVPVYLIAGNHDIGGWDSTNPPPGTARRNWWKFYGWSWLEETSDFYPYYTQNYTFSYNSQNFIALESYDNYDSFMYEIYGEDSFTSLQLEYLENLINQYPTDENIILFYHYDFSEQINLSELGADMALWGHIHSNDGSIYQHPYNLATDEVCDETRAYRVIKVNENELSPHYTSYAGYNGDNLTIDFSPANNGSYETVTASISNQQNIDFEHGLIKFQMPAAADDYDIDNGILEQVINFQSYNLCYVNVNIPANSTIEVTITGFDTPVDYNTTSGQPVAINAYPNPFTKITNFEYYLPQKEPLEITIYNLKGEKIVTLYDNIASKGNSQITWNGKNSKNKSIGSGIYLYRFKTSSKEIVKKLLFIK